MRRNARSEERHDWLGLVQDLQTAGDLDGVELLVGVGYCKGVVPAEERLIKLLHEALGMLSPSNMAQPISQRELLETLLAAVRIRGLHGSVHKVVAEAYRCCNFTQWPNWEFADDMSSAFQRNKDAINNALAATAIYQTRKKLEDAYVGALLLSSAEVMDLILKPLEPINAIIAAEIAEIKTSTSPDRVLADMLLAQPKARKVLSQALEAGLRQFFRVQIQAALNAA